MNVCSSCVRRVVSCRVTAPLCSAYTSIQATGCAAIFREVPRGTEGQHLVKLPKEVKAKRGHVDNAASASPAAKKARTSNASTSSGRRSSSSANGTVGGDSSGGLSRGSGGGTGGNSLAALTETKKEPKGPGANPIHCSRLAFSAALTVLPAILDVVPAATARPLGGSSDGVVTPSAASCCVE